MQQRVLPDGRLTQKGLEATKEIVITCFTRVATSAFFDEVTEGVLRTFRQFYHYDLEYGIE